MPAENHNRQLLFFIDDSPDDAAMIERVVKKAGWPLAFQWADDAEQALEILSNWSGSRSDIIIMDIKMPKLTGLEILERLSARDRLRQLPPITILSSSTLGGDITSAESYPNVTYQSKPDGYRGLKSLLHQLIPQKLAKH